jgi:hypothetical protein
MDVENTDLERHVSTPEQSYRFSLPLWPKGSQNFWIGYNKYSRTITHWALTSRTTPTRPDTQSSLSSKWRA